MRNAEYKVRLAAFTLTELMVLVAMGSLLTGLMLPNLSQTRSKLLQQACVANMKQWGMVFFLYSQDYSGKLFSYDNSTGNWDDSSIMGGVPNPYTRYLPNANPTSSTIIRVVRICPAVLALIPPPPTSSGGPHTYSLVLPSIFRNGIGWHVIPSDPASGWTFLDLSVLTRPSQFLLLMDTYSGNTLSVGMLVSNTQNITNRHSGTFNLMFGDFHVQNVPFSTLQQQNTLPIAQNPWFQMQ